MKTQLLCTFTSPETLDVDLQILRQEYNIVYNYIYILNNADDENELFVTFNIDSDYTNDAYLKNTILVHRKKQTNTLYTINALNEVIKKENNGVLDKKYPVDWESYQNSIILTNKDRSLRIVDTEIYDILKFSKN